MSNIATTPSFTAEFAIGYRDMIVPTLARERETTTKVIQAIPKTRLDYRPDPKSRTAIEIADHIVQSEVWFLNSIAAGAFPYEEPKPLGNAEAILAFYEKGFPPAYEKVMKLSANQLLAIIDFFGMKVPNFSCLDFAKIHSVHHRGQLSTYLRAMGGKVPDIYGGSADEPWNP